MTTTKPKTLPDDPKKRLAEFETEGESHPRQKTRLHSKEQARFYIGYHHLSEILPEQFSFYSDLADVHMEIMMSYKGERSNDVRDMFKGMGEDDILKVGHQAIDRELGKKAHGNRDR